MEETKNIQLLNQERKESELEFLYDQYCQNIPIPYESIEKLKKAGYIDNEPNERKKKQPAKDTSDHVVKNTAEQLADSMVDVIMEENPSFEDEIIYEEENQDRDYTYQGGKEITKKDWSVSSTLSHSKEFIEWINQMLSGDFINLKPYKKHELYCQQVTNWMSENKNVMDFSSASEKEEYLLSEFKRCSENTLYFMNKYGTLKEGNFSSGKRYYRAKKVHSIIFYLIDCGYSIIIGKPRQIGATSALGGVAVKKIIFSKNLFLKFITQDKDTGEEIFEDKIKYLFSELPEWMKPEVLNDRDNLFKLGRKEKKGTRRGVDSKLQVVAPSISAINGGSPNVVFIDEAGYISILSGMIKEARPTMFVEDPDTGRREMRRQIVVWGTGGEMDRGGKSYEREYMSILKDWRDRNHNSGIVPIFFDWATIPGISKELYNSEMKTYYGVEGPESEKSKIQFHQHYPSKIEDMFLTTSKTLVSAEYINKQLDRIAAMPHDDKPKYGYFDPVFDSTQPADENSDVPFKIIGSKFVECEEGDERISTIMFKEPVEGWINRYYSGTDPISSDNGFSKMSKTILDEVERTIACVVNYRDSNHKYTFLQIMLAGLYYDTKERQGIPELVESNIGQAYIDYVDNKGFYQSLVYRTELPEYLRGGQSIIGIDNRGNRNKMIINKMFEMIQAYGDNICIDEFFMQLKTFVCKVTPNGNETWGTIDKKFYRDDILFGAVFAYICRLSYMHLTPKQVDGEDSEFKTVYVLQRDDTGMLRRVPQKQKIA